MRIRFARLAAATRPFRYGLGKRFRWAAAVRVRKARTARFIAITGSSGKSTTTALLAHVLGRHGRVRAQVVRNTLVHVAQAVRETRPDDEFVVLELGIGKVGDMTALADVARPDITIVTLVGIQHYAAFRGKEAVAAEKGKLVEATSPDGVVILNADDEHVMDMARRSSARVVTIGRERPADYRVTRVEQSFPGPLIVDVAWRGETYRLEANLVGDYFWLSVVAAFAAAVEAGMPPKAIGQAIAGFEPLPGRCSVTRVKGGPVFLVDTAKAPWESLLLPIRTLAAIDAPRKRIVIGQISDYAGNSRSKYRDAYAAARAVADEVIFVGDNAHRHRASKEDVAQGRIVEVATAKQLHEHLRATAVEGEVILLKSAQNLHLERAVLAFEDDVQCWTEKCGRHGNCVFCGMYGHPFREHRAIRRQARRDRLLRRLLAFLSPVRGDG